MVRIVIDPALEKKEFVCRPDRRCLRKPSDDLRRRPISPEKYAAYVDLAAPEVPARSNL